MPIPLSESEITSDAEFEAIRDRRIQEDWTLMVVHSEATGGCGEGMLVKGQHLILVELLS